MKNYTAFVANCIISGEKFRNNKRNLIELNLNGFNIELLQLGDFYKRSIASENKGKCLHTTNIYIKNLKKADFAKAQETIKYLTELLSFITCSEVFSFGYRYYTERYKSCIGSIQTSWPIINLINGKETKSFLECVWLTYTALREGRQLNVAIDYFTSSEHPELAIEIRLGITFILLENLKHTFARQKGYPFIGGFFRVMGATSTRARTKSFKPLLTEMLKTVGMSPTLDDVIKIRNAIIHSGLTNILFDERLNIYTSCQNIVREYILRLLNYKGRYKLCDDDNYKTM